VSNNNKRGRKTKKLTLHTLWCLNNNGGRRITNDLKIRIIAIKKPKENNQIIVPKHHYPRVIVALGRSLAGTAQVA
jgi:hypothetical protein